jgi:hypothetical protein
MKRFLLLCCATFMILTVMAQDAEEEKGFQKERLFMGGNFGLSFGDFTLINISPQLGYRFSNLFAAGFGINGQYVGVKRRNFAGQPISKTSQGVIGLNVFGRIYPIQYLMLQVQPEANYIFGKQTFYGSPSQEYKMDASIVPSLLLGAGFVIPSGRGSMIISVFYDALQDPDAPYGTRPFINFGFNIPLH